MALTKRTPGKPLSEAEIEQRREAARARWAKAGAAAAGAAAGAAIGMQVGYHRATIRNENDIRAATRAAARRAEETIGAADRRIEAGAVRRETAIREAFRWRRRANPETQKERQQRFSRTLEEARNPQSATPKPQRPPVIGTLQNARIYAYQIDQTQRRLTREEKHLARLKAAEEAAFNGVPGAKEPNPREVRQIGARIGQLKRDLDELRRLDAHAHEPKVRQAYEQTRKGKSIKVATHTARQFRGGETLKQRQRRITDAKRELSERETRLLDQLDRRTARLRQASRQGIGEETEAAVVRAFRQGRYGARVARAAGRLGLIGAGAGAIAGLAANQLFGKAETLAKAAPKEKPEDAMARRLGAVFRSWMDQITGATPQLDIEGDLSSAMAPVSQAFRQGAQKPDLDTEASSPRIIEFDFDKLNPAVREQVDTYKLGRIREISTAQRETIRAVLRQAIVDGAPPDAMARQIKESIGLTTAQAAMVRNFRLQLQSLDARALDRQLRDKRYDRTVRKAIDSGTPLEAEQIDKMVDAYQRRFVALRAMTIARTEALRAENYGNLAGIRQMLAENPDMTVVKTWLATEDDRTRDTHRELDGKQSLGIDTPFLTTQGSIIRYPHDPDAPPEETINCRCTLRFTAIPKSTAISRFLTAEAV